MNFSTLSSNEKLAVYGSVAVIVGGLIGFYGVGFIAVLAAIAMLAIVFLPQMSPTTTLPGSKGSLMLLAGGVAAVVLVLSLLLYSGVLFAFSSAFASILFLVAVAGGVVMAWAGWQEFQAEGGKFQLGNAGGSSTPPPAAPPPAAPPPASSAPEGDSSNDDNAGQP